MNPDSPKANIFINDITNGQENVEISFINEIDSTGLCESVTYTPNNILTSDTLTDDFESIPVPCKCNDSCFTGCSCSLGSNIAYQNDILCEDYFREITKPIIECSALCPCTSCPNRVVQKGIKIHLQVFKTVNRGFGVKTLDFISKHTFICEYAGELIDKEEIYRRIKNRKADQPNYIYVLNEYSSQLLNTCTIIDPTYHGNVGRYLNHSCSPNLIPIPVRANSMIPRICFFAKYDISPKEELTYNYGTSMMQENNIEISPPKDSNLIGDRKKCYCKSSQCVGFLPFDNF